MADRRISRRKSKAKLHAGAGGSRGPFEVIKGGRGDAGTVSPEGVPVPVVDGKPGSDGLTNKQRAFARAMLKGAGSQSAAYREAYDAEGMSANAVAREASLLMHHPKVAQMMDRGFKVQEHGAACSAAAVRLRLETFLAEVLDGQHGEEVTDAVTGDTVTLAPSLTARLKALDLWGKSERVAFFLDRSADMAVEDLSAEDIRTKLTETLGTLFPDADAG